MGNLLSAHLDWRLLPLGLNSSLILLKKAIGFCWGLSLLWAPTRSTSTCQDHAWPQMWTLCFQAWLSRCPGSLQGQGHSAGCRVGGHQAHSGCSGGALPLASLCAAWMVLERSQAPGPADIFSGADATLGLQLRVAAAATLGKRHLPLLPLLLCLPLAFVGVVPFFKAESYLQGRDLVSLRSLLCPLCSSHTAPTCLSPALFLVARIPALNTIPNLSLCPLGGISGSHLAFHTSPL